MNHAGWWRLVAFSTFSTESEYIHTYTAGGLRREELHTETSPKPLLLSVRYSCYFLEFIHTCDVKVESAIPDDISLTADTLILAARCLHQEKRASCSRLLGDRILDHTSSPDPQFGVQLGNQPRRASGSEGSISYSGKGTSLSASCMIGVRP